MLKVDYLLIICDDTITGLSSPTLWPIFSLTEERHGCPGVTGFVFASLRSRANRKQPQFCGTYSCVLQKPETMVYSKNLQPKALFTHKEIQPDIITFKNDPLLFSIVSMNNRQNGL